MTELDAFDNYALEYDKWFENHAVEYALELQAIRESLPQEGNGIEIGAGTGRFTQPLGISLGVEPSAAMRSLALRRGANVIAGTAESLPVEDGAYDFALLGTVDCFFGAPESAFREVNRALIATGYGMVGLIDKDIKSGKKYDKTKSER